MHVTIADVLLHRDVITPREAATLTLAIGRAWDRQKAMRGDVGLPDASAIALHDSGEITFLLTPAAVSADGPSSLSALLAHLLGVHEADAPTHRVPGGLLISIAGQLGSMELPSRNEEGFRAALVRFADDRPDVLVNVFWRIAGARPVSARRGARLSMPERRRQTRVVAELRRELRDVERRAFDARIAKAAALARRDAAREQRQMIAALTIACAIVVGLVAALGIRNTESAVPEAATSAPPVEQSAQAPEPAVTKAPDAVASAAVETQPVRPFAVRTTRKAAPPRAAAIERQPKRRVVSFPGGTRGITWSHAGR